MTAKLNALAINSLLIVVSTIVGYLILEAIFFRLVLPELRFNARPFLPETPGALVQTSKAGYAPRNYVAIMGDSYAEGVGDEMLDVDGNEARGFHAAHVIHDLTGRDVVTFGKGGAGSAEAFVRLPTRAIEGSRCLIFPTIEDPRQILAYFYEGNDIEENLSFAAKVAHAYGQADARAIERYLSAQYGTFGTWHCHLYLGDNISRMVRFLNEYYLKKTDPFHTAEKSQNTFLIADRASAAPAVLGPALSVEPAGIRTAIEVFDRSLAWLRQRFAHVPITVVYIPSPLATYRLDAPSVAYFMIDDTGYHARAAAAEHVALNSDRICTLVREVAARQGTGFLDSRPALRAAAAARPIHGPIDWLHFNHAGYQVFGEILARRLPDPDALDGCSPALVPPGG
jgi:GDSL-like Lipase/Acylhydrolase family